MATIKPPLSSYMTGTPSGVTKPPLSSYMKSPMIDKSKQMGLTESPIGGLPIIKQATQFGTGIGSSIGKGIFGATSLFLKGARKVADIIGAKDSYLPKIQKGVETVGKGVFEEPVKKETASLFGKVGEFTGDVAQFALTGKPTVAAQEKLLPLAEKIPGKIAQYLGKKTAQIAPEIVGTGAVEYVKSGGDTKSAVETGIGAGIISGLTHIGADAFRSLVPQTVRDNFARVLNYTGKTGLKDTTGGKVDNAVNAFTTIRNLAPDIKVIDKNGIEKAFEPSKTDFIELPQALGQAKDHIYNAYTDLANKAGDASAKFGQADFTKVISELDKYSGKGYTQAFSTKAEQIKQALQRFGTLNPKDGKYYFTDTSPEEIQKLIQNINRDINPGSDRAGSDVSQEASQAIRKIMDEKITNATGNPDYQKLRTAYSQILGIENDVLNNWKKAMRKSRTNPGIIDGIATLDAIGGIVTGDAYKVGKGIGIETIKKAFQYLRDPEVNLRKAFKMLDDAEKGTKPSTTTSRLFGGKSYPQKSLESEAPINAAKTVDKNVIDKSVPQSSTKSTIDLFGGQKRSQNIDQEIKSFPRDTSLKGQDAKVQEKSIDKYIKNKDKLTKEYIKINGKNVNIDEARKLFSDVGYMGTNSAAVQEASSAVAKDVWKNLLKTSKEPEAFIYAGGSGTGKTTAAKNLLSDRLEKAGAVLDGNLSTMKSAQSRIKESFDAGKEPLITYVYRKPEDAWDGVIKRMKDNPEEGGRVVPLSVFIQNHEGSYNVVKQIVKDEMAPVVLINNTGAKKNADFMSLDEFNKISYNKNLKDKLLKETKKLYENRTITKDQYEALIK